MLCLMSRTNNKNCMWPCRQKYNNDIKNKTHNAIEFYLLGKRTLIEKLCDVISTFFPYILVSAFISCHFSLILHICFCFTVSFIAFSSSPCSYFLFYWLFSIPRHFRIPFHHFSFTTSFPRFLFSHILLSQFHIISLHWYVFYLPFARVSTRLLVFHICVFTLLFEWILHLFHLFLFSYFPSHHDILLFFS